MRIRISILSSAVLAALFPVTPVCAQDSSTGLITADGISLTVQDEVLKTEEDNTYGLYALNSGEIIASAVNVATLGENSSAVAARSGSQIELIGNSISTQGSKSHGLDAKDAGTTIRAKDVHISTTDWEAAAVRAITDSHVRLENVSINAQSQTYGAILLHSASLSSTGTSIVNSEAGGGIVSMGGSILFNNGSIHTLGNGITLNDSLDYSRVARAQILKTSIVADTAGLVLSGMGSTALLDAVKITIVGDDSVNLKAGVLLTTLDGTSSAEIHNSSIETYGKTIHGVTNFGGKAALVGTSITTEGENSFGILSEGSYVRSLIDTENVKVRTVSHRSAGATILEGELGFKGGSITTSGDLSYGIVADGMAKSAVVGVSGARINTEGKEAHGIVAGTSTLDLNGVQLFARGQDALGIWMYGRTPTGQGSLLLSAGSWVDAQNAAAIRLSGGSHQLSISDSTVVGRAGTEAGTLLRVEDATGVLPLEQMLAPSAAVPGPPVAVHRVDFDASGSNLYGDVVVESATADVQVALRNGTTFSGALRDDSGYRVAQLILDDSSQWNVRANSSVGALEHAGTIAFDAPTMGGFKTVTVDGDYVGNGGHWIFNRALGDDTSLGDQLIIQGNSSGTANVSVRNAGGAGALTHEGIRLVTVAGQSDAQFNLQGRAVAGAYDYFLFKGGVSTPDDGHWYLRSEYAPPIEPPQPPVDPPEPTEPPEPPEPPIEPIEPTLPPDPPIDPPRPQVERPEPAVYLANRSAALGMFRHSFHDRAGGPATQANGGGDAVAWLHLLSAQPDSHDRNRQVQVDGQISSLLVGAGRRFEVGGTGELQVGAMLGHGRARNDSRSQVTGYTASGVVNGTSVGVYATWLQDARMEGGAYVDGWLQYGRFRNSVQGEGLQKERYDASNWSASAETGYVVPVQRTAQRGIYLEPQLQVIQSRYDADRVAEVNGTVVEGRDKNSTTTRVGLRLYTRSLTQRQGQVQPFVSVNWWSGGNDAAIAVDGERLRRQLPRDIYEAKAGLQVNLSGGWRGWGEISRQTGGMGFRDTSAQLGLSYSW